MKKSAYVRSMLPRLGAVLLVAVAAGFVVAEEPGEPASVYESGKFQLGDGQPPPGFPGMARILRDPALAGPDWESLFTADRKFRDDFPYDAEGNPQGNGVPDFQELYDGQWAVFSADNISRGIHLDTTVLTPGGRVQRGKPVADHDLGNLYVYSTHDGAGNLLLFAGAERLGTGDSHIEFEFNQAHVRLGHGPPWVITGERVPGDLLVRLDFTGGALGSLTVQQWKEVDAEPGTFFYETVASLAGEGCDAASTLCAVCNAADIDGGPWVNFDDQGDPEILSAGRFPELGVNVGALLGAQPQFISVQIRTPQDIAFGHFGEEVWE